MKPVYYHTLLLLLVLSGPVLRAQQQTLYVSSSKGSDNNPGTEELPLKTIQACVDQWNGSGQFTCKCEGVFTETVSILKGGPSARQRNILTAWDTDKDGDLEDETFTIDGQRSRNIGIETGVSAGGKASNVEVSHVRIVNLEPPGGCGDKSALSFVSIRCPGGGSANGCLNWWIHHCSFDSLGMECNAGSGYIALQPSNAYNLLVEQNRISHFGGFLMRYFDSSKNVSFLNNTVYMNAAGLKAWGREVDHLRIEGNYFECDGNGYNDPKDSGKCANSTAVNFSNDIQHGLIKNNHFKDCLTAIALGSNAPFGSRDNAHHIIEGNYIEMSSKVCNLYSSAIKIDDDPERVSDLTGDSLEVRDVTFRNNFIIYRGPGFQGPAFLLKSGHDHRFSNDIKIYNNTISGFRNGIQIAEFNKKYKLNGITIYNNMVDRVEDET